MTKLHIQKLKTMSKQDNELIKAALKKAEYETLKKKAMLNQIVIQAGKNGEIVRVPAREVFQKLYNEPVPEF